MFGAYRFFLASLVVINHAGVAIGGFRLGPTAVVGFYLISGFVISFLIDHRIKGPLLKAFYAERFFRIYPQFFFHLLASILFLAVTGHVSRFSQTWPDINGVAANLALFPLQMRAFSDHLAGSLYVPTSWSLSLEVSFYLVAPFILRSRLLDIAAWASFLIFFLAVIGKIPPQPHTFSYATIFGTLHFFAVGAWLQRRQFKKAGAWCAAVIATAALISFYASWRPPHVQEVIVGALFGLACVASLRRVATPSFKRLDDFLGRVSYPVFLNHFLFIWGFETLGWTVNTLTSQLAILAGSWAFGCASFLLVERPIDAYRRSLRTSSAIAARDPGEAIRNS